MSALYTYFLANKPSRSCVPIVSGPNRKVVPKLKLPNTSTDTGRYTPSHLFSYLGVKAKVVTWCTMRYCGDILGDIIAVNAIPKLLRM